MKRMAFATLICLLLAPAFAAADVIHLKNGNALEVDSAEVKGDFVVFTIFGGKMSIQLVAVDRIEKRAYDPEAAPQLAGGVGNPVAARGVYAQPGTTAGAQGTDAGIGGTEEGENEQLIQFYIAQKVQIEKENYFYKQQINTLNSVIYAKSAVFSDTRPERTKIAEMQEQIEANNQRIAIMLDDARKQGLLPGDIRRIDIAKFEPPISTETEQLQPDFDSADPIYDQSMDESIYDDTSEDEISSEDTGEEPEEGPGR